MVVASLLLALVFASSASAAVVSNERHSWAEESDLFECDTTTVSIQGVHHEVIRDNGSHYTLIARGEEADGTRWRIANVGNQSLSGSPSASTGQIRWVRQGEEWSEDDWSQVATGDGHHTFTGCR